MKFLFTFLSFFIFSNPIFSQSNWFSDGAEWTYRVSDFFNPEDTVSITKVTGDTIINGEEAKILTVFLPDETTDYYFHERNDTVFFINQYENYEWDIAYDFTRNEGDTVYWYNRTGVVQEKGVLDFNGFSRRYMAVNQQLNAPPSAYYWKWYVEGIGNVGRVLNGNSSCGHIVPDFWFCSAIETPPHFTFNCYSSPGWNYDPNSICILTSTEKEIIEQKVKIYPNPSSNLLNIETNFNFSAIEIIDITGKIRATINENQKEVNIENLSAGLYFLRLTNDKNIVLEKFTVH